MLARKKDRALEKMIMAEEDDNDLDADASDFDSEKMWCFQNSVVPQPQQSIGSTVQSEEGNADENESESQDDSNKITDLDERTVRRAYLLTYSQADMERFPTVEDFASAVVEAFSKTGHPVVQYAGCIENHRDGNKHFHLAVSVKNLRRWLKVKEYLEEHHQIVVNFQDREDCVGYVAAYRYVSKRGKNIVVLSSGHPDLRVIGSPRTKKCMIANKNRASQRKRKSEESTTSSSQKRAKTKRLSMTDVAEYVLDNNVKSLTELQSIAMQRRSNGEKDLFSFLVKNSTKNVAELIERTWKMSAAPAEHEAAQQEPLSRMDKLRKAGETPCIEGCNGRWLACAKQVLQWNGINVYVFSGAVRDLLLKGRKKHLNIFICGEANCAKSFLFEPLEEIYTCFTTPACGKFAWDGLDKAEVAFINDFRWKKECIDWQELLLLLEGAPVKLCRPKNLHATDMLIPRANTIPFFATGPRPIEYLGAYGQRDDRETDMMSSRWKLFEFTHKIAKDQVVVLDPCVNCFVKLVLLGDNQ